MPFFVMKIYFILIYNCKQEKLEAYKLLVFQYDTYNIQLNHLFFYSYEENNTFFLNILHHLKNKFHPLTKLLLF